MVKLVNLYILTSLEYIAIFGQLKFINVEILSNAFNVPCIICTLLIINNFLLESRMTLNLWYYIAIGVYNFMGTILMV